MRPTPRLLLALALLAPPATASVMAEVSVETLARQAELVVEGTVVSVRTVRADEGRRLFTLATLTVDDRLKGPDHPQVVVVFPGGVDGDLQQRVSGVPLPQVGERLIVLLKRRPGRGELWDLTALGLSVWRVREGHAYRAIEGLEWTTGPVKPPKVAPPVDALKTQLREAAK